MAVPEAQMALTLDRVEGQLIQVPYKLGRRTVRELGNRCGAAIADPDSNVVEFFVAEDDAADWPEGVTVLDCLAWILVPADRRRTAPGRHWAHWMPRHERNTPAGILADALHTAAKAAT